MGELPQTVDGKSELAISCVHRHPHRVFYPTPRTSCAVDALHHTPTGADITDTDTGNEPQVRVCSTKTSHGNISPGLMDLQEESMQ